MGADKKAANEMTKKLTDLAKALQQNATVNGATEGAAKIPGWNKLNMAWSFSNNNCSKLSRHSNRWLQAFRHKYNDPFRWAWLCQTR